MTDVPTKAERDQWRDLHERHDHVDADRTETWSDCFACGGDWPCPVVRLLDALDTTEARVIECEWALRKIVQGWVDGYKINPGYLEHARALLDGNTDG